jgi:hypothetical protein
MSFTRLAGLAGLSFAIIVVLINVGLGATGWPLDAGTAPAEVARYFADHGGVIGLDVSISLFNVVLIAIFCAGAFAAIWRVERDRGEAWSAVGLIGVAAMTGSFVAVVAIRAALTAGHDPSGGIWDLHNALFTAVGIGLGTVLIGFSIGGVRTATIRRWHAILGLVSGILLVVSALLTPVMVGGGPAGLAAIGLVGFVGWLVWLASFGVVLLRRDRIGPPSGAIGPVGHGAGRQDSRA